ncbi:MAG: OmpA family protein [Planctomycetota bacterium]
MPWDCATCNTEALADDVRVCPNCQTEKLAWTIDPTQTRTLQMTSKRRFEVLRGEGSTPLAAGASYAKVVTSEAERLLVVPKQRVRDYQAAGKQPPPDQVVFVRLFPDKWASDPAKLTLTLTPEYELRSMEEAELEVPQETAPKLQEGRFDVRLLFVSGEGALDASFPELRVVDIGEATQRGHAGKVGFEALKKKRRVLLTDPLEKGWCRRLECKQLQFNHDSHLILPEGLPVLALVLEYLEGHPKERLLITGHTDATGEDKGYDNLGLSRRRAENILHLLVGDQAAWAQSALDCRQHLIKQGTPKKAELDARMVEDWVGVPEGEGFAGFQKIAQLRLRTPLAATSWDDVAAWAAVYRFYELALIDQVAPPLASRALRKKITATAKSANKAYKEVAKQELGAWGPTQRAAKLERQRGVAKGAFVDPERRTLGCGAHYLKIKTDKKSRTNRRNEFLFYEPDRLPFAAGATLSDDEVGEAVYGSRETWDYVRSDGPYTFDRLDCPPEPLIAPPAGDVVVVVDVSGSMVSNTDPGRPVNRLELCREQLVEFVNALGREQKFTLIPFATKVLPAWAPKLMPANLFNKQSALDWLNRELWPPAEDMTNTSAALKAGLEFAKTHGAQSLVFLSDGLPTVGNVNERAILGAVERLWRPPGVAIHTYGFLINPADLGATSEHQAQVRARFKELWLDLSGDQQTKKDVKDAALRKIATELKLKSDVVEALVLGDFMRDLATEQNGQPLFHDLNAMMDAR